MTTTIGTEMVTLAVTGMTCGSCKRRVENALTAVPGVAEAEVDVARGTAVVSYDPAATASDNLLQAVRAAGYGAEITAAQTRALPLAAMGCACCASH